MASNTHVSRMARRLKGKCVGVDGVTTQQECGVHRSMGPLGTALCGIRIALMPERLIGFLFKLTPDKIGSMSCMKDSVSVGSIAS